MTFTFEQFHVFINLPKLLFTLWHNFASAVTVFFMFDAYPRRIYSECIPFPSKQNYLFDHPRTAAVSSIRVSRTGKFSFQSNMRIYLFIRGLPRHVPQTDSSNESFALVHTVTVARPVWITTTLSGWLLLNYFDTYSFVFLCRVCHPFFLIQKKFPL